jgi:NAD(P)-dependent dehydrogenase (short-subunit alcohol dehydrogenase family)
MSLNPPIAGWAGRRAWIVGGSTGIGLALAQALHAAGAQVIVSARDRAALERFAGEHARSLALPLDVADAAQLGQAAQHAFAAGPLDLVVYCAGHYRETTAAGYDLQQMLLHLDVNYAGVLRLLDAVLPRLLAQGRGHISLLASVAGWRGLPRSLAYGPTKAALIHLAEALHLELQPRSLGVSVVNPGFVATRLTAQNSFRMPALITPAEAAAATLRGWEEGRFEIHYPRRFTWPMKLLAALPFGLYRPIVQRGTRP